MGRTVSGVVLRGQFLKSGLMCRHCVGLGGRSGRSDGRLDAGSDTAGGVVCTSGTDCQ